MTIASGMRPRRLRLPTALADGGTGARTAQEAVSALGVPSLDGDNTFTGNNSFGGSGVYTNRVWTDSDLTFLTTDLFNFEDGGGTNYVEFLGAGRSIAFQDASGTLALTGDPVKAPYVAKSGVYGASTADCVINCTGTWTLTLPTAVGVSGRFYFIKNSGAGVITMAGTGGQTFDGVGSPTVAAGASLTVCSDGANWLIL